MSVELIELLFNVAILLWIATMACFACILCMHILIPKSFLQAYFKEPYFSPAEIDFFSGFSFAYIRTIMFMCLAGFPNSGKKRGLTEAYKMHHAGFKWLLK
jgi:hypothetical protein